MHFSKGLLSRSALRTDMARDDSFTTLIARIEALPADQRGSQALRLSASLLELAAYELAGSVASDDVAEMIETAALLSEKSVECAGAEQIGGKVARRLN